MSDLAHHMLIHDMSMRAFPEFPSWRSWLHKAGCRDLSKADRGLQIDDSAAALRTAISGNGVALGRTSLVERDIAEGRLVRLFTEAQACELAYYLVYRPENENATSLLAFKEWLMLEAGAGEASSHPAQDGSLTFQEAGNGPPP